MSYFKFRQGLLLAQATQTVAQRATCWRGASPPKKMRIPMSIPLSSFILALTLTFIQGFKVQASRCATENGERRSRKKIIHTYAQYRDMTSVITLKLPCCIEKFHLYQLAELLTLAGTYVVNCCCCCSALLLLPRTFDIVLKFADRY